MTKILLGGQIILYLALVVFSYAYVDLNLTLSQNPYLLNFIKTMQGLGFYNRPTATIIYTGLIFLLFTFYFLLLRQKNLSLKIIFWSAGIISFILLLGYPFSSYDIFNYIFNAKMVLVYGANPHIQVAMDFPSDPYLRFMHNIHTPAPYGYLWTALSLPPYILGFGKFLSTFLAFKAWVLLFYFADLFLIYKLLQRIDFERKFSNLAFFAFNPLVLIETGIVGHNDVVFMFFILLALYLLIISKRFLSLLGLLSSYALKFVSLILTPLFFVKAVFKDFDFGKWAAIFFLVFLLFQRFVPFQPWYIIWPLTMVTISKSRFWQNFLIIISLAVLFRYSAYLYFGNWDEPVPTILWLISFLIPLFYLFLKTTKWEKFLPNID